MWTEMLNHKVENLSLWTLSVEELLKKQLEKSFGGIENFFIIFNFSPKGKDFKAGIFAV